MPQPGVAGSMQPQFVPTGQAPLNGGMPQPPILLPTGAPLLNGGVPQPALPLAQPGGGLGMLPGSFAGAAPMPAPVAAPPFGLGGLGGAPLGLPGLDMPLDAVGVGGFGAASVALSAGLGRGGDEAVSAEGGGGKGRNKTAKQQEANKIAQQRYRERKKVGRRLADGAAAGLLAGFAVFGRCAVLVRSAAGNGCPPETHKWHGWLT